MLPIQVVLLTRIFELSDRVADLADPDRRYAAQTLLRDAEDLARSGYYHACDVRIERVERGL